MSEADIINELAGIPPGSALAALREQRAETKTFAQGSYLALLEPDDPGDVSRFERAAIALRVASLEKCQVAADHYRGLLTGLGVDANGLTRIEAESSSVGPGDRLDAILRHTDLLTREPRHASPESLAVLRTAGLSSREIVTISQLIAFASYQVRMIALLQAMGDRA